MAKSNSFPGIGLEATLYLMVLALIVGTSGGGSAQTGSLPGAPSTLPSPSTSAPVILSDHASRLGNNRPAAEAAVLVDRELYRDRNMTWEAFIQTTPEQLKVLDYTDPTAISVSGGQVTQLKLVLATESAATLNAFRAGTTRDPEHRHEREVIGRVMKVLRQRFPRAQLEVQVFFGESSQHAEATYPGDVLNYRVLDTL